MAAPTKKIAPTIEEVTPEVIAVEKPVTAPLPLLGTSRPIFTTTVEDAPMPAKARALNPKTLAEQAAGRAAISQYLPAE